VTDGALGAALVDTALHGTMLHGGAPHAASPACRWLSWGDAHGVWCFGAGDGHEGLTTPPGGH